MPRLGSHSSFSTSWNPGSPMTNCLTIHRETMSSTKVVVMATCFAARSSRRNKKSGISPAIGMTTRSECAGGLDEAMVVELVDVVLVHEDPIDRTGCARQRCGIRPVTDVHRESDRDPD